MSASDGIGMTDLEIRNRIRQLERDKQDLENRVYDLEAQLRAVEGRLDQLDNEVRYGSR